MKTTVEGKFAPLGYKRWVIPEGTIPNTSHGANPEMVSHEVACA